MTTTQNPPDRLDDQGMRGSQGLSVVEAPCIPADQGLCDFQQNRVGGDPNLRSDQHGYGTHNGVVAAEQTSRPANLQPTVMDAAPGGDLNCGDQSGPDPQGQCVAAPVPPAPAMDAPASKAVAPVLADPVLSLAAEMLDDLERVRIANENRFRQLTRTEVDEDGVQRGLGMPADHPVVESTAKLVEATAHLEQQAIKNLERIVRKHPLGPWAKSMKGVGDKQVARLLASVGDPYWNVKYDRPRTVAELRSYCGWGDARAQVRRRGEQATWSDTAKKRVWVIADSCIKQIREPCKGTRPDGRVWAEHEENCACSPYRRVYDEARRKYEGTLHDVECRRCGPAGKPAQPGSARSDGHLNAMAYRLMCKAILKDLWIEARRLHGVE